MDPRVRISPPPLMTKIQKILEFISFAEKLKVELRHSYTSNIKRRESVAEHTWMMCLLAVILQKEIKTKINLEKALKMIIVHDLAEVFAGDIPAFEKSIRATNKQKNESIAMDKLLTYLPNKTLVREFKKLWLEFEECKKAEARYAQAMDKVEVIIQHNIADIRTFGQGDFDINPYYKNDRFDFDDFLREFKDKVDVDTMNKIQRAGLMKRVPKYHQDRWAEK